MKSKKAVVINFIIIFSVFLFFAQNIQTNASEKKDFFEISDRASFENFIKKSRKDPGINGKLTKDIVLNDKEAFESQNNLYSFESVYGGTAKDKTPYTGEFDGQGHSITGYVSCENLPMFNIIDRTAYIHDLTIDYSVFTPTHNRSDYDETEYCASMSQVNYGHIKNCKINATVTGRGLCAGIAGVNEKSGVIEGCSFSGRVVGGIGIKTLSDPTMEYAYDFVVINNGVIKDTVCDAVIKSVAGLSVPYTLDGYPSSKDSSTDDKDNKKADGDKKDKTPAGKKDESAAGKKDETAASEDAAGKTGKEDSKADDPGREENYIGPDRDTVIKLVKGDTLWAISRIYYGAGIKYTNLKLKDKTGKFGGLEGHVLTRLQIGTEVLIPRLEINE